MCICICILKLSRSITKTHQGSLRLALSWDCRKGVKRFFLLRKSKSNQQIFGSQERFTQLLYVSQLCMILCNS